MVGTCDLLAAAVPVLALENTFHEPMHYPCMRVHVYLCVCVCAFPFGLLPLVVLLLICYSLLSFARDCFTASSLAVAHIYAHRPQKQTTKNSTTNVSWSY